VKQATQNCDCGCRHTLAIRARGGKNFSPLQSEGEKRLLCVYLLTSGSLLSARLDVRVALGLGCLRDQARFHESRLSCIPCDGRFERSCDELPGSAFGSSAKALVKSVSPS
jgi:hypothetical protein